MGTQTIDEILDDVFNIGRSRHPEDYEVLKEGIKLALYELIEKEIIPKYMDISKAAKQPELDKLLFGYQKADAMSNAMAMRVATMNVMSSYQKAKLKALFGEK